MERLEARMVVVRVQLAGGLLVVKVIGRRRLVGRQIAEVRTKGGRRRALRVGMLRVGMLQSRLVVKVSGQWRLRRLC